MNTFHKKVHSHLKIIYQNILIDEEINSDIFLITYGDSIFSAKNKKLKTLKNFVDEFIKPYFNNIHILPFSHLVQMMVFLSLITKKFVMI